MFNTLLETAAQCGFVRCAWIPAQASTSFPHFEHYLDAGMNYLAKRRQARRHPDSILPEVQSLLMLAMPFATVLDSEPNHPVKQLKGIAEYARGADYHIFIKKRLRILEDKHRELLPSGRCRSVVDTAPLLEKEFAAAAGLGFIGKNTLLIHPHYGSKLFLAALLSSEPFRSLSSRCPATENCGDCRRCLDACPTGALVEPYVLDTRKCLSYWTIEHDCERNGELPPDIAEKRGGRFFGCDVCQQVCPYYQKPPEPTEGTIDPFSLDKNALRSFVLGSALEKLIVKR